MIKHRTIIIPASVQPNARALCKGLAGVAGDGMFTTGLSATGKAPATHYIASGAVGDDVVHLLVDPVALAEATGMTPENTEALLATCDVIRLGQNTAPEGEPPNAETLQQTLGRLELKQIQAKMLVM